MSRNASGSDRSRRQRLPSALRFVLLSVAVLFLAASVSGDALARTRSYAVMDYETGVILSAVNEDKRLHPASLTKMMTLYMVFEAIRDGRFSLDQRIRVSKRAASMPPSRLGLRAGQRVRLRHLIAAAAVRSANDAAVVLAETVGGTEWKFAEMMTRKARSFGMNGTTFKNATGFTADGHLSTARDMVVLGRRLLRDFPEHAGTYGRLSIRWGGRALRATNSRFLQAFRGADGIKTGYTRAAGYTIVATAERNGRRVITSYFGASSSGRRASRVAQLMNQGFERLEQPGTLIARPAEPPVPRPAGRQAAEPTQALASASTSEIVPPLPRLDVTPEVVGPEQTYSRPAPRTSGTPLASPADGPDFYEDPKSTPAQGDWSIQVGAYAREAQAVRHLRNVSTAHADITGRASPMTTRRSRYYLAQFAGYEEGEARAACRSLRRRGVDCLPVLPDKAATTSEVAAIPEPPGSVPSTTAVGGWSIQVGAYSRKSRAEAHLHDVNAAHADITSRATPITPRRNRYYLAQFTGFDENGAKSACGVLQRRGVDCLPILGAERYEPAAVAAVAEAVLPQSARQWAVQVGAYTRREQAEAHLQDVSQLHSDITGSATPTTMKRRRYFLAQFAGFNEDGAASACRTLRKRGVDCLPVAPSGTGEPASIAAAAQTALRPPAGRWSIQIGAFSRREQAEAHLRNVSAAHNDIAGEATQLTPKRNRYYLAQLSGFDEDAALSACGTLQKRGVDCLPLAPSATEEVSETTASMEPELPPSAPQWAVQVGAYSRADSARAQIERLRHAGLAPISGQDFQVARSGKLFLAWFTGFDEASAKEACQSLETLQTDCLAVRARTRPVEGASLRADSDWTVQVGAFRRNRDASRHLDRIRSSNIDELEGREGGIKRRGRYYLVQFQPFTAAEAGTACDALLNQGIDCLAKGPRRTERNSGRSDWAIQVGAYSRATQARAQLNRVMGKSLSELEGARHWVPQQGRLYLARLRNLNQHSATAACNALRSDGVECLPLAPSRN